MDAEAEAARVEPPPPAPRPGWYVRRRDKVILGITLAVILAVIGVVRWAAVTQAVWVVNGLDVPVQVAFDGDATAVDAGGRVRLRLSRDVHRARVSTAGGELLEEHLIEVPTEADVVVYNVLGAAPLYVQRVTYAAVQPRQEDGSAPDFLGGQRLATRRNVHYLFEEAPRSISVKERSGTVVRFRLDVAPGGFRTTLGYLEHRQEHLRVAELYRAVARAEPGQSGLLEPAILAIHAAQGVDAAAAFAREARDRAPGDPEAHATYQWLMRRAGRSQALREEYRALAAARPDAPMLAALAARIAPREEAAARLRELYARYPDDPSVQRYAARALFLDGRHAESLAIYEKLAASGDPQYLKDADDHARALVAEGRAAEAFAMVTKLLGGTASEDTWVAMLHGRLAQLPEVKGGGVDAPGWEHVARLDARQPGLLSWTRSAFGDIDGVMTMDTIDGATRSAINAHLEAATLRGSAWKLCSEMAPAALARLHPVPALLLAGELARTGDRALAERVLEGQLQWPFPPAAMLDYVLTGAEHPDQWQLDPEMRAALAFVRARKLAESGQKSPELEAQAAREDLLQGVVARARALWPPPASSTAGAIVLRRRPQP